MVASDYVEHLSKLKLSAAKYCACEPVNVFPHFGSRHTYLCTSMFSLLYDVCFLIILDLQYGQYTPFVHLILSRYCRHFSSLGMNSSAPSAGPVVVVCFSICGVNLFTYYTNHE